MSGPPGGERGEHETCGKEVLGQVEACRPRQPCHGGKYHQLKLNRYISKTLERMFSNTIHGNKLRMD